MSVFLYDSFDLLFNMLAYSCRCIQSLGPQYWYPWTTKECGTWGLQYGKDSTLGNNCISGSGLQFTTLLMNITFLLMLYFVAKPWDNNLSTVFEMKRIISHYLYSFEVFFFFNLFIQSWGFDYTTKHKGGKRRLFRCTGLYLYVS